MRATRGPLGGATGGDAVVCGSSTGPSGSAELTAAYGIICDDARDAALAADCLHERFLYAKNIVLPISSAVACCVAKAAQYPDDVSASAAFEAATAASRCGGMAGQVQVRRDFEQLNHLAMRQEWTDDTPVSPEIFDQQGPGKTGAERAL